MYGSNAKTLLIGENVFEEILFRCMHVDIKFFFFNYLRLSVCFRIINFSKRSNLHLLLFPLKG